MCNVNTKKNVDEVTNKTSNALMRKTKAQLVEIILRKDSVEKDLQNNIKDKNKEINNIQNNLSINIDKYAALKQELINLKNDYEDICDEYASYKCLVHNIIKHKNILIIFLIICLLVNIFIMFYLY